MVVSTATTTLQDQLFNQDLPLVQAGLGEHLPSRHGAEGPHQLPLFAALAAAAARRRPLAGRACCSSRRSSGSPPPTGDRADLHLSAAEEESWQRLAAVTEACTPQRCSYHRIGVCFLARARRRLKEPHRDRQPRAAAVRRWPVATASCPTRRPDCRRGAPPRGRGAQLWAGGSGIASCSIGWSGCGAAAARARSARRWARSPPRAADWSTRSARGARARAAGAAQLGARRSGASSRCCCACWRTPS